MGSKCFPINESPLIFPAGNIFRSLRSEVLLYHVFTGFSDFLWNHQYQAIHFILLFLLSKCLKYSHCKSQAIAVTQLSNISIVVAGILFLYPLDFRKHTVNRIAEHSDTYINIIFKANKSDMLCLFPLSMAPVSFTAVIFSDHIG